MEIDSRCPKRVQKPHLRKVRFWRKPDIEVYLNLDQFVPFAGATSVLFVMDETISQNRVITEALYVAPLQPRRFIKICPARAVRERRRRLCV
jgi:hypothetical protein